MLTINLDDRELQEHLARLADREVRTAASWALNDTAADVLTHVQTRMEEAFDRPTGFTKNAFMVKRARVSDLEAEVKERPSVGKRHFLKVQEHGGRRGRTGLEGLLDARLAYDGIITAVVPAGGAKLDAYGNWSTGERNQALSAVQAQRDQSTNTTAAARKRKRKRAGFFVPSAESKLSPGIWKRAPDGTISKVLHFTRSMPAYDQRLGFFDGAREVYEARLPAHLRRTIEKMAARVAAKAR
ncbi:hypothetical protein RGQ15_07095 [Paracoccus sp. MBLB3053]|uniref:HK97 gp10 family phage protein n=1 Tax=Paracoccus aurantius TaxID=3073814 RepID=A0ABU2HQL0_9RHOB|nr:hypothetical protein [Paracoccus sp. MBLB3053]MDS9467339.1 hypothetical protein [Paracoccus sp. MBLB3053]